MLIIHWIITATLAAGTPAGDFPVIHDELTGSAINKKIWKASRMGTVSPDKKGVLVKSGPGEEAAGLILKRKVNPEDYYTFSAELFPVPEAMNGYAVTVGGPGWLLLCGGDGRFWLEAGGRILAATGSNPSGQWYRVSVDNRPELLRVSVTSPAGKVIGSWTAVTGPGLSEPVGFSALAGGTNPGPRAMRVRKAEFRMQNPPATTETPVAHDAWTSRITNWTLGGKGTLAVRPEGQRGNPCLCATLSQGGELRFKFDHPVDVDRIHQIMFSLSVQTKDPSYNVQYVLISDEGRFLHIDQMNNSGGWNWKEMVLYPDLAEAWNSPNRHKISAFGIQFAWLEVPAEIRIDGLFFRMFKEKP